ncbi:MAG: spore maturation protein [Candidatus Paraimprobicoccus trichonymphae]|uniref:Spore maturation protein n=1 Tax=Candidatus Paraimprobicoccus trichonymphae TaxID=3033793 RepID=A0AA48KWE1_9FIRM|nr:MAG: spore maturation protein [Candidatus Paraimprobicoccus trichonymphae]
MIEILNKFGYYIIPTIIFSIIFHGLIKNVQIFQVFVNGAKEGLQSVFLITPSLIGLITAVEILKISGALDIFSSLISPITNFFRVPSEVVPLILLRPVSGGGTLALLENILKTHGGNSLISKIYCLIMGSTETTFYTLAVYFGYINIKRTRYVIPCSLIIELTSIILALLLAS